MSTAAHEPRRVGPRRADSPSGSKVTPRRNVPETSESNGVQYDSDELPVLIRLPNLRDVNSVEAPPAATSQKKRQRIDRSRANKPKASKQDAAKVNKKSYQQQAGANKLVFGGIVGGVLVVVMLFLFNGSSSTPPTDQDGWANEADELESLVQQPEVSIPTANEAPPLYPGFAYEAPDSETAQFASGQLEQTPIGVPYFNGPQAPGESETAALSTQRRTVDGWPAEALGSQSTSGSKPKDFWPNEGLSLEQGGYEYPPTDTPGQTDFRSSMYPSETEAYRMGKLESERPPATPRGSSSILNGNIEIPDTTSLR